MMKYERKSNIDMSVILLSHGLVYFPLSRTSALKIHRGLQVSQMQYKSIQLSLGKTYSMEAITF